MKQSAGFKLLAGIVSFAVAALLIVVLVNRLQAGDGMISRPAVNEAASYLDYPLETITGDTTSLREYRGDVLLLVNVASKCGFTPQYEGLQQLEETYADKRFHVIGFPANNFLNQEPGTNEEILAFCTGEYDVTFPMMAKISVKGDNIHPLYRYLTSESPERGEITWNFNKFLLDREGKVVARFGSKTEPRDETLEGTIRDLLADTGGM